MHTQRLSIGFSITRRLALCGVIAALGLVSPELTAQISVLWWDSTPDYGGQAADPLRKEMSDYLDTFGGGSVFNSTYVSSESPGTLATHLAGASYDVLLFDATSSVAKFNGADLAAVQSHYQTKSNVLLDGTLYIRSIVYDAGSDFPGPFGATGALLANEIHQLGSRGGGIFIGTDHTGYQVDANQVLGSIIPGAAFSGFTVPSTDGVFFGTQMLNSIVPVAPANIFSHWDSIPSQAVAPIGNFTDFFGRSVTLHSQVNVADDPGGGTRYPYISTSWAPGAGEIIITDPNAPDPDPNPNPDPLTPVPEPSTYGLIGAGMLIGVIALRRWKQRAKEKAAA